MWLLGVVVRRYIDFLILLIPTPLVSVLFYSICIIITCARGHELSGRVRAHANNYYAWMECAWVTK